MAALLDQLTRELLERWRERQRRPTLCVWRGPWGASHSLAIVNGAMADALERAGVTVCRRAPESPPLPLQVATVTSSWPPVFAPGSAGPLVLYQPWELGHIPAAWVEEIRRRVDEVWTPSEYARQAFLRSGIAPDLVHVVPNGVDLDRVSPRGPRLPLPTDKGTVFLFVGGTTYRKGIDLLLTAFLRAFTAADDVALVVKAGCKDTFYRGQTADHMLDRFRSLTGAPELVEIDEPLPSTAMPSLYRAAHVLVQPYRGEGFCLPVLEALACGLPVIVTAGGPTDDVVSDACAWRIPARPVPVPPSDLRLAGEGTLLEPDLAALVAALRQAADPAARAGKAAAARAHARPWGWASAAAQAKARLHALQRGLPVRRVEPVAPPNRGRVLFVAHACWEEERTWKPAFLAYAQAFPPEADTTLALAGPPCEGTVARLAAALADAGLSQAAVADVAVIEVEEERERVGLELAADAVIVAGGPPPLRARRVVSPHPAALRAVAEEAAI